MTYPAQEHFPEACFECPTLVGMIEDGVFGRYPLESISSVAVNAVIEENDPDMAGWLSGGKCSGSFVVESEKGGQPMKEIYCGRESELES